MSQADLNANREVRKIFVRHWIDLGRISVRSANGRVTVRGTLTRVQTAPDPLTSVLVEGMYNELKRIHGVRFVLMELNNWENKTGRWIPVGGKDSKPSAANPLSVPGAVSQGKTLEI